MDSEYSLLDILGSSSILQIGKANWAAGEYTQASMDNLKIWNKALDAGNNSEKCSLLLPGAGNGSRLEAGNRLSVTLKMARAFFRTTAEQLPGNRKWTRSLSERTDLTAEVQAPAVGEEDLTGTLDRGNLPGNSDC